MARILIVDDSPTDVRVLTGMLERAGHQVSSAASAEGGIARAREGVPGLILMDVSMPGTHGFDELNTTAHAWFVPTAAAPKVPADASEWATMRDDWRKNLDEKVFRGWAKEATPTEVDERRSRSGRRVEVDLTFSGDPQLKLTAVVDVPREGLSAESVQLLIAENEGYSWTSPSDPKATSPANAGFTPRGLGGTLWDQSPKKQTQHQRRFMLLGQTLAGQQVYDIRRAILALHTVPELKDAKITLVAEGPRSLPPEVSSFWRRARLPRRGPCR